MKNPDITRKKKLLLIGGAADVLMCMLIKLTNMQDAEAGCELRGNRWLIVVAGCRKINLSR